MRTDTQCLRTHAAFQKKTEDLVEWEMSLDAAFSSQAGREPCTQGPSIQLLVGTRTQVLPSATTFLETLFKSGETFKFEVEKSFQTKHFKWCALLSNGQWPLG